MQINGIKLKLVLASFFACIFFTLAARAQAATYYISPTVSGNGSCLTAANSCLWATAYGKSDVTEIIVRGGTYPMSAAWTIAKNGLKVLAATGETSVLDGAYAWPTASRYTPLVDVTGNSNTISGLSITRSWGRGLEVNGDSNYIHHVNSYGNASEGIIITGPSSSNQATSNIIEDCNVYENVLLGLHQTDPSQTVIPEPPYGWSEFSNPSAFMFQSSSLNTARRCKVYNNYWEGLGFYNGSRNDTFEDGEIYGNMKLQAYMSSSYGGTLRNNIIYGTASWYGSLTCNGMSAVSLGGENWAVNVPAGFVKDYGHRVYGNYIAGARYNVWIGGETLAPIRNAYVFNNALIQAQDRVGVEGVGVFIDSRTGGEGNVLKNNAILQSINTRCSDPDPNRVDFSYNLWDSAPSDTDCRGTGDVNGSFALAGGFATAPASGSLSESSFAFSGADPGAQNGGAWLTTLSASASSTTTISVADVGYFRGDEDVYFQGGTTRTLTGKTSTNGEGWGPGTLTLSSAVTLSSGVGIQIADFVTANKSNIGPWDFGGNDTQAPSAPGGLSVR